VSVLIPQNLTQSNRYNRWCEWFQPWTAEIHSASFFSLN